MRLFDKKTYENENSEYAPNNDDLNTNWKMKD